MITIEAVQQQILAADMGRWAECLPQQIHQALASDRHGDLGRWQQLLRLLPDIKTDDVDLNADALRIGQPGMLEEATRKDVLQVLRACNPGAKGRMNYLE